MYDMGTWTLGVGCSWTVGALSQLMLVRGGLEVLAPQFG